MTLSATVVITTKDRRDDLAKAIESALSQTASPDVLVMDDASTDGTPDMIRDRFPRVRLERAESSRGYIVARNQAARLIQTDIIFSLDDDAIFSTSTIVAQILAEFQDPRIGVVAIPFIDVNRGPRVLQQAPDANISITDSFQGTAYAVRRDLFTHLGGFREYLFHQGEERDFSIRMLAAGYVVRLGGADPIHHFESPRRNFRRRDLYGRRNDVLFAWHNVPMPHLPAHLAATTFNGLRTGWQVRRPWRMIQGLAQGYACIPHEWSRRAPVPRNIYTLSRLLRRRGSMPLEEIKSLLPPIKPLS